MGLDWGLGHALILVPYERGWWIVKLKNFVLYLLSIHVDKKKMHQFPGGNPSIIRDA